MSPPAMLCRTALSIRLAASCWTRRGSPSRAAGWMSARTCRSRRLIAGRAAARAALVMAARSAGWCSPVPASLLARVSSASIRRSCSALEASSSRLRACQVLVVAAGSARVTSSRVRSRVSGVSNSCEALAANRRWASKEASSRANRPSRVSAEFLELVVGSVQGQPLVQAAGGDPPGGGGDCAQRAQHPAGQEPADRGGGHRDRPLGRWRRRSAAAACRRRSAPDSPHGPPPLPAGR